MTSRIADRLHPVMVGGVIGCLAALGLSVGLLDLWSLRATDRFFLPHEGNAAITIVAIDDASIGQLGRWPWPRKIHADLIRALNAAGAKLIAYDVNFPEPSDDMNDRALADELRAAGNVVLPVELKLEISQGALTFNPSATVAPIPSFAGTAKATGHSNTPPDADGVMRRVPRSVRAPDQSSIPAFAAEVARLWGVETHVAAAPVDALGRVVVNYANQPQRAFRVVSAADVIRGTAPAEALRDKVVFVGATASDLHDALMVPTSDGIPMPGVEIHASVFDTLLTQRWLRNVSMPIQAAFVILLGLLVAVLISKLRARWSITVIFVVWICTVILAFVLFDRGWILDVIWPTVTLLLATIGVSLERRIASDRQRRQLKTVLSQYVSKSVVEAILKDPSKMKLGGERRRMSVLFSDIRGFTTISEGLGPEQLVQILNIYLNRMTNIVFSHTGVLDKYIGDAVMAFWNAPFDQPDHAKLAVRTALDMRRALVEMNRAKTFGDLELRIGIGINTGDAIVGNVGGDARFDYTVIGDTVNLASRLEGLTKEYGVTAVVTEATKGELGDEFLLRKLDSVAVKGKKEPAVIYEVMEYASSADGAMKQLVSDFEGALEAYFARRFSETAATCEKILVSVPFDGPAKTLLERAKHFIESPPPEAWNGTWVYTKK